MLAISANDTQTLFRLLSLSLPPYMPFHLSSHTKDGSTWTIAVTDEVINLHNSNDSATYLDKHLSSGYRVEESNSYQLSDPDSVTQNRTNDNYENVTDGDPALKNLQEELAKADSGYGSSARMFLNHVKQARKLVTPTIHTSEKLNTEPELDASVHTSASSALSATLTETEAVSDLLGREKLTQALHRLLTEREDDHPFAIGLFGHWGAGKSSQVNFLQAELKKTGKPKILVAEFNAWQNEKATNLAAMLAQAVVDGLVADKSLWEKLKLAVRLSAFRHSHTRKSLENDWRSLTIWLLWMWVLLPPVGLLLLLWWVPLHNEVLAPIFKTLAWISATLASGYHFTRSHLTEWFKRLDMKKSISMLALPDYSTHQGLILEIHRTLRDLCALCLTGKSPKEGSYLLLIVDDLDRCGVDSVKDVLDAIRLVANIPRVVTLVAIDERMAYAAVEKHYHQYGHAGRSPELVARDYLAKVLQVSVTLPEVDHDGIGSYVDQKIFGDIDLSNVAQTARESVDYNALQENLNEDVTSSTQQNIVAITKLAEAAITPKEVTSSSESLPTNQVPPQQSSLPKEKDMFKELAQTYAFSNPRLLWRHYMAWKLLKSLTLGTSYTLKDVEIPMQLLFWREWLHQLSSEKRALYSEWIKNMRGQNKPQGMPDAIFQSVKLRLRPNWGKAIPLIMAVDAVLLPANQSEVINTAKSRKEIGSNKADE